MTWYFSFIGDGDDPSFSWDAPAQRFSTGNLPTRLAPKDKFQSLGIGVPWVRNLIVQGRYPGKQLDWGAWGIVLTGDQLRGLLSSHPAVMKTLEELPERAYYILVAAEGN